MTKEQAIEIISKYLNFNEICGTRNFKEAIETVLSMLKEKDKEIEEKQDKIYELEDNIDTMKQNGIFNIENFKWQLRNDNLYTRELEEFIDNYMRFYNKERGVKNGYID